jgi:beta-glucosidase
VTPLDGVLSRVGLRTNVVFAQGYRSPVRRKMKEFGVGGVARHTQIDDASAPSAAELVAQAVAAARQAEVAIVFAGLSHDEHGDTEGSDRQDLQLPHGQDELIAQVVAANPRTVVVLYAGGPVTMNPWLEQVPAVLCAWYPGMEGGHAVAAVLFGDINPSGRLPCSFPRRLSDAAAHHAGDARAYPGVDGTVHYLEGLLIGYRWHDTRNIAPLFPFGHGLSYTKFMLSDLRLVEAGGVVTIGCDVQNTGRCRGAEVVQVYIEPLSPPVPRPVRELKGFAKIHLARSEKRTVEIQLPPRAFAFYDPDRGGWVQAAGDYVIHVGNSSRNLLLHLRRHIDFTSLIP